jgi:hypothetical protein
MLSEAQIDALPFAPQEEDAVALEERERADFFAEIGIDEAEPARDRVYADAELDMLLERLGAVEAEAARNREVAALRVEQIRAWAEGANRPLETRAGWLRLAIQARAEAYDYGSKKSRSLPHGSFGLRRRADTLEVTDPAAALAFAKANGLEVKESVNKTPLLHHFKATGELPDGTEFRSGADEFFIKATGGAS